MRDLLESLDRIIEAPRGEKGGGDASNIRGKPKPEDPRTVTNKKFGSIGDFIKAIQTPGQQGGSTAAQTRANLAKATAPKINPNVPAGGPLRANPVDPQQAAVARAAKAVVNPAPMPADQASARGTQAIAKAAAPKMATPTAPPPRPKQRAKVAATAANTKDFDKTMAIQKKLQAQGFDIKADGIMGKNTRAAMAAAQAKSAQANRAGSQGGRTAAQAASAPQAPATTQVAKAPAGTAVQTGGAGGEFGTASAPTQGQQSIANIRDKVKQDKAGQATAAAERPGILSRIAGVFRGGGNRRAERDAENQRSAQAYRDRIGSTKTAAGAGVTPAPTISMRGDNQQPAATTQTAAANTVTFTDRRAIKFAKAADAALKAGNTRAASKLQANARNIQRAVTQSDPNYVPPVASQANIDRSQRLGGVY